MNVFLFPYPRHVEIQTQQERATAGRWIKVESDLSSPMLQAAEAFVDKVNTYFAHTVELTAGTPKVGVILLTIEPVNGDLRSQQYRLTSDSKGIRLSGGSESALFWGLKTLEQLLSQTGTYVPEFTIDDEPDFDQRGYMLDVSRCKVPTMSTLYRLIDQLASLKFNQLQLYMEHTFAFSAHQRVWADASPFTAAEILAIDRYCRDRFIQLVPNFNSFGHMERWLQFDEYKPLAECPDGYESQWGFRESGVLKPNADSLAFLDSLYVELLPNFTSRLFNIGCDETWELGQGWSKELCETKGKNRVYLDFLLQVAALADKYGRTAMFWGDIILSQPELIADLPKNIIALNWGYAAEHNFADETAKFAESGVPFYVCPGTSAWNSISGRTENCIGNLINAAENGKKNGAAGYLLTDWGDGGHHQYLPISWLGISAGAAFSWCLESNRKADWADVINRLWAHDRSGVIGEYLVELGRILNLFKTPGIRGMCYALDLREPMNPLPDYVEPVDVSELRSALQKTLELRARLEDARPEIENRTLLLGELRNSSYMIEAGLKKMLLMKKADVDLPALLDLFRLVIRNHQDLWLARNRNGGLYESSAFLRRSMDELAGRDSLRKY
jgi:hypothetical protein